MVETLEGVRGLRKWLRNNPGKVPPYLILGWIVKRILAEVANGGAEKLAERLKAVAIPWLQKRPLGVPEGRNRISEI